jgi:hypothetical protein
MKCCIMLRLNYTSVLCTCMKLFEFEFGFKFDLKSIENIKRKAIGKFQENRKLNSAQTTHLDLVQQRARRPSLTAEHRLSMLRSRPRVPAPPLPLPSGADLSALVSFTHTPCSLCRAGPACQCWLPIRSLSLVYGSRLSNPSLPNRRKHDPCVAVDSAATTHAEATPVPPPTFSSCPVTHTLTSSLTRALATPRYSPHRARTHGTPLPSAVVSGLFHCHHRVPAVSISR